MRVKLATFLFMLFNTISYSQSIIRTITIDDNMQLLQLSNKAYVHQTISKFDGFGNVSSNGLILVDSSEAFLFDTPATPQQTQQLVAWISDSLHANISTFVPNHWHRDCIGGLAYLHSIGVKSYANQLTINLATQNGVTVPQNAFTDSLTLQINNTKITCYYLGGGHTPDNIVVWIPSEKILFAGCMVKDMNAKGLGNTADAAPLQQWLSTINKVSNKFKTAVIVIPGHGAIGGIELLKHTQSLLLKELKKK